MLFTSSWNFDAQQMTLLCYPLNAAQPMGRSTPQEESPNGDTTSHEVSPNGDTTPHEVSPKEGHKEAGSDDKSYETAV